MPMAGKGSRFQGFSDTPKPLIEVLGVPMFFWSMLSLQPLWEASRFTLVLYKKDNLATRIREFLKDKKINFQIVELEERTTGAAWTLLAAKPYLNSESTLISLDCDLCFQCEAFVNNLKAPLLTDTDGQLCYFTSQEQRFSYVQTSYDCVEKIAEKQVISDKAVAGAYCFRRAAEAWKQIEKHTPDASKELYISQIISGMISEGAKFRAYLTQQFFSLGTPQELDRSIKDKAFSSLTARLKALC